MVTPPAALSTSLSCRMRIVSRKRDIFLGFDFFMWTFLPVWRIARRVEIPGAMAGRLGAILTFIVSAFRDPFRDRQAGAPME
ncbi:MAG: hypothetical protein DMF53_01755 [Acidobacteria bacterium]|nr:MAG: hypothetical protein DMF53_01755 [Acidobacteriota bacterium]